MRASTWLLVGLGAALLLGGGAAYVITRGIRNNNPGNIREGAGDRTDWRGERATDDDSAFEEFNTPEDGIRAIAVILRTYRTRYGVQTVAQIIRRWAPSSENDTQAYIDAVARISGLQPWETVRDPEDYPRFIAAIIRQENGVQPYSVAQIERGVQAA